MPNHSFKRTAFGSRLSQTLGFTETPVSRRTACLLNLLTVTLLCAGCTSSDWFWQRSTHEPQGSVLLSSGERAQIFVKCETKFLSNASCVQAFGSTSIGSKFAFRDITSSVWEALRGTPKFKEWPVIVARRPFLPPQSVRLAPFRIVLVAVDPVIVLLLPSPPNDSATAGLEQGTLLVH